MQRMFTNIFCVQNTVNHDRHLQCAEHRQFSPSCCVCAEHRQFSLSCCMCRTQTNRTQTILTFMLCVQNTDNSHRDMLMLCLQNIDNSVMLSVQNTDKQTTDNSHRHAVCQNTDNSHCHVVCADCRQLSLSCCVCRTQEHRQVSPSCCVWRTQTIPTVMLCVQNTDNSHRHVVCRTQTNRAQTILTVMLCAEHRQREHRQFSLSFCACRTQLGGGVDTSISGADDSVW